MSLSALPPMRVPTLTEVVDWSALTPIASSPSRPDALSPDSDHLPVLSEALAPEDCPIVVAMPARIDEEMLTQRILADLQRKIDLMLEHRLRTALTPMVERLTQTLAHESRDELALTLRDMVADAVSQELLRQRGSADSVQAG